MLPMFRAIPAMRVVEDLVAPRATLELHDVYRLHTRPIASDASRIDQLDAHSFRKEIELTHVFDSIRSGRFQGNDSRFIIPAQDLPPANQ